MSSLRQLAYFVAVAEEGSFTRAAARMYVAQPSLSQQVRTLEAELGGDLIERLPRGIRLTASGKAFLPHARQAVRSADRAMREGRLALQVEAGEIEISAVRSLVVGLLPDLIIQWYREHPEVKVRPYEFGRRDLAEESVRDGLSDMGIGPPPTDWAGPVVTLGWDEIVIVVAPDDRLASRRTVPLAVLSQREWVMFERGHGLDQMVVKCCASLGGFQPARALETSQVESGARFAAAGLGPALVPRSIIPPGLDAAILASDPPIGRSITAYTRSQWEPQAAAFVDLMRRQGWPERPPGSFIAD